MPVIKKIVTLSLIGKSEQEEALGRQGRYFKS
jgi:hypothetical protein